ncbi:MAG: hypothetical protein WDN47_02995 [Candidatus Doudnabacteria bacterium]
MDSHNHKQAPRGYKREEGVPKNGFGDNLPHRIAGLEKAKTEPGMSPADIAALDRSIAKLKEKLEASNEPKVQE